MFADFSSEKTVAFVVARLSSSRFPAKHLRKIGPKRIIDWTLESLRQCRQIDQIVIATVAESENEPLREIAAEQNIDCYWYQGEVDHVTTRLRKAAQAFDADICLLISGDCPLIYAPAVDELVGQLKADPGADHIQVPPTEEGLFPATEGIGIYRRRAWELADDLSDRPELKEHQFPLIGMRPDLFQGKTCSLAADLYGEQHRFSVDTYSDLEFMNVVYRALEAEAKSFTAPEVLALLTRRGELKNINAHVYQRLLVEDIKRLLFIVDAGQDYGFGHLMRCVELAQQIVERCSYPVTFLVDDQVASRILTEKGFKTVWGAYGRSPRPGSPGGEQNLSRLLENQDLVLLDIYGGRQLTEGWKQDFTGRSVAVLDNLSPWTEVADLVIIPGVTAPEEALQNRQESVLAGKDYVILRREVLSAGNANTAKDLDLLAYLHCDEQRQQVREFGVQHNLKIHVIEGFQQDFPALLARSRYYLANFGYGFYEALSLGAYPVNWPVSASHAADSLKFYQRLGLLPQIVETQSNLSDVLLPLLQTEPLSNFILRDGTPEIVDALANLVTGLQAKESTR